MYLSGSSMAAGVVTGTAALMIEHARNQFGVAPTANALKAMLQHTAFTLTDGCGVAYDVLSRARAP